jgi:Spy/CpxP family protein refolding chaperone
MEALRFWKILALVLALVNIGVLGFFWWNRPPGPPPGKQGVRELIASLHFNSAQKARADTLRLEHQAAMAEFVQKSAALRRQLYQLTAVTPIDTIAAGRLMDQLAAEGKRMERVTFDHFRKVRDIGTPEQKRLFDQGIGDAVSGMLLRPPR